MSRPDKPAPVSRPPAPPLVARALTRAQRLVDTPRQDPRPLSWYVEADQVGDLGILAVWLAAEAKLSHSAP